MKIQKRKMVISSILLLSAIGLYTMAVRWGGFASWYSENVYAHLSVLFAFLCGIVPFSVVEIGIYAFIGAIIYGIVHRIILVSRKKQSFFMAMISGVTSLLLIASTLLFLYVVNCGVNYHGTSFVEKEMFAVKEYTKEELMKVCKKLTKEINKLESLLEKDEDGTVVIGNDVEWMAREEMERLGKRYASLSGYYPRPKTLLISEILSYQQVSGIYSPFTVEANVNGDMPAYMKPFTMCHELAHLKGVMREEEANFVGYLACYNSELAYFRYSGAMMAYYYCMTELRSYDAQAFVTIRNKLCETANVDILKKNEFWASYEGAIATASQKVNDVYLKINDQSEGINSYNEVVGLIIELYR